MTWRHIVVATVVTIVALCSLLVLVWLASGDASDTLCAYWPPPQMHEHVRSELVVRAPGITPGGDFDGDGVADELAVECFHMEPLFAPTTSGMVYVRSGRTRAVLLAHAVDTPFTPAFWCGDRDGNGTDDVVVAGGEQRILLERVAGG